MNNEFIISGIQQIGIGTDDVYATWKWYHQNFGMNVPIFDEAAEAGLMLPYTGGNPQSRHAVLALNLSGGGGAEIWQYTSRKPQFSDEKIMPGDFGLFAAKFKSRNIDESYKILSQSNKLSEIYLNPFYGRYFYLQDHHGNAIQVVEGQDWFSNRKDHTGGVCGAIIGVKDLETSINFYTKILQFDEVHQWDDHNDVFAFHGGQGSFRRAILRRSTENAGPFADLLGTPQIELIQSKEYKGKKIFDNRYWGDPGFIHLCFDVVNMNDLKTYCAQQQAEFTVDSGNFDMGDASGRFAYIEDPDGTLIEFVETFKIPIIKKVNWYLDLRKRPKGKKLPAWMLKAMGMNRVKEVKVPTKGN